MNRRNFLKWISKLLAALPFIALADLPPEPIESLTIDWQSSAGWTFDNETLGLWQKNQMFALRTMPWELEAPREEVERLNEILAEVDSRLVPWFIAE